MRLLIVDDIQENLDLLEDVLGEHGYHCVKVHNGVEALEVLHDLSFHLIIADAMMPRMDGLQLCKEVKTNPAWSKIPFVIYTANYVDREEEELAASIGVDKYVVKYAGLNSLVEAVNELCRLRYGFTGDTPPDTGKTIDDVAFLEKHHAILVRKLEEKMAELEMYAETLARKNRELQASEGRYRSLFEQASIAIVLIDGETGKVLDANRQALQLLGYTREELRSLDHFPVVGEYQGKNPLHTKARALTGDTALRTRAGDVIEVEISAATFDQPHDMRLMLFMTDTSEEKNMRRQLLQAEKMMLMGCLAAGIAHDIRNPLAAVRINLQFLQQRMNQKDSDAESIESSLEGTRRIEQIIENTLNFARLTPPALASEHINTLVERALWFTKVPVQQKHLTLDVQFSDQIPAVLVDGNQIQQVLLNLLQNAVEASPEHDRIVITTGVIDGDGSSQRVFVAIKDHGNGIPPDQMDNLFKPFQTTKVGGTGLGLTLSHHIIERHGAEIRVSSEVGVGTTVRLLFPIHSSP